MAHKLGGRTATTSLVIIVITLLAGLLPASTSAAPKDQERWDSKYSSDEYIFVKSQKRMQLP